MDAIAQKLSSMKGWLKFLGILSIIGGAFQALTIIGIIFAWLPIWMGVILYQAGDKAEQYINAKEEGILVEFMGKLNTYFTIMGVLALVGIGLAVLTIAIAIIAGISLPQYLPHTKF